MFSQMPSMKKIQYKEIKSNREYTIHSNKKKFYLNNFILSNFTTFCVKNVLKSSTEEIVWETAVRIVFQRHVTVKPVFAKEVVQRDGSYPYVMKVFIKLSLLTYLYLKHLYVF